jgi:hypothetical protein
MNLYEAIAVLLHNVAEPCGVVVVCLGDGRRLTLRETLELLNASDPVVVRTTLDAPCSVLCGDTCHLHTDSLHAAAAYAAAREVTQRVHHGTATEDDRALMQAVAAWPPWPVVGDAVMRAHVLVNVACGYSSVAALLPYARTPVLALARRVLGPSLDAHSLAELSTANCSDAVIVRVLGDIKKDLSRNSTV